MNAKFELWQTLSVYYMIDLAYNQTHNERLAAVGQEIRDERDQMQYVWKKDNIRRKA